MNVGLPGTGIGGLFYVLMAIWLPMREMLWKVAGANREVHWRAVIRQMVLAFLLVGALWLSGEIMGRVIFLFASWGQGQGYFQTLNLQSVATGKYNVVKLPFIYLTFAAILLLQVVTQMVRLIIRVLKLRIG